MNKIWRWLLFLAGKLSVGFVLKTYDDSSAREVAYWMGYTRWHLV